MIYTDTMDDIKKGRIPVLRNDASMHLKAAFPERFTITKKESFYSSNISTAYIVNHDDFMTLNIYLGGQKQHVPYMIDLTPENMGLIDRKNAFKTIAAFIPSENRVLTTAEDFHQCVNDGDKIEFLYLDGKELKIKRGVKSGRLIVCRNGVKRFDINSFGSVIIGGWIL